MVFTGHRNTAVIGRFIGLTTDVILLFICPDDNNTVASQ